MRPLFIFTNRSEAEMPAYKKEITRYDHPQYKRWCSMNQRCLNPEKVEHERRSPHVKVEPIWAQDNPDGFFNFVKWIEAKLVEKPELKDAEYRIIRIDLKKDYGPDNCKLGTQQAATQHRVTSVLTEELVIKMRRYKRANPDASLTGMEKLFEQSYVNISRALRGITWSSVNHIEPPIPKFGTVEQEQEDEQRTAPVE